MGMIGMYAIVVIALIAAGAALGIVALVTLGIRHEEKVGRVSGVCGITPPATTGRQFRERREP